MNVNDFRKAILGSDFDDWICYDDYGTWVLKSDLLISIEREDSGDLDPFFEEWATKHPDPHAYRKRYLIKYAGNIIYDVNAASVDGGRAVIPWPNAETNEIEPFANKIGEIVNNNLQEYYDYIRRCRLNVVEQTS